MRTSTFVALFLTAGAVHAQDNMSGGAYNVRLQDIQSRVDELQEQARIAKQRLRTISKGVDTPSLVRLDVDVDNETTSAFKLVSAKVLLDGALQYERHDDALGNERRLPALTGAVAPGAHTAQVEIVLQGNGYGIFTYLRGYKITLSSAHTFAVENSKPAHVTATAYELSDVTVPLERRPQITWSGSR
jgi:hypothetical protein